MVSSRVQQWVDITLVLSSLFQGGKRGVLLPQTVVPTILSHAPLGSSLMLVSSPTHIGVHTKRSIVSRSGYTMTMPS